MISKLRSNKKWLTNQHRNAYAISAEKLSTPVKGHLTSYLLKSKSVEPNYAIISVT
jgi:hypothetical protein